MANQSRTIRQLRTAGCAPWDRLNQALATPRRFRLFRQDLIELLAETEIPFLPETGRPEFLEREAPSQNATPGDPLEAYWVELRRLKPTRRQEEFVLARGLDLLRDALLEVFRRHPSAPLRALLQERLSPYSRVSQDLREIPAEELPGTIHTEARDRVHQRLQELHQLTQALVDRNLHLVPAIAARYRQVGVPWEDLIQEGNTALLRGVERYDHHEGVRFSHYATWWIQQGILKALSCQSRTVRLPVYLAQAVHRVRNVCAASPETLDAEIIADRARISRDRVERALAADRPCFSLDRPLNNQDEDMPYAEGLADQRPAPEPDEPTLTELHRTLERLLERLPAREALVLRMRFGMEDGVPRTLEEVRKHLGVSRERVRQLQAQSLRRLTAPTPQRELTRFL